MGVNPVTNNIIPRRGGSRTARPLPLSNHPSFPAKHSRASSRSTPFPPAPLPLSSRMRGPIPLPVSQRPTGRGGSRTARPFPSLTTRHSQLSTAESRNLVVVAPPPSRAPPVVLADAGTHPPARHSSAPLRVGAVRRTVPTLPLSNHPSPSEASGVEESRCRSIPFPPAPPVVLAEPIPPVSHMVGAANRPSPSPL